MKVVKVKSMQLDHESLTFVLGLSTAVGVIMSVFLYFKNPQVDTEKDAIKLLDRVANMEKTVTEIRETHLRALEVEIKNLNISVNDLSRTVIKLSTILDERLPRTKLN